MSHNKAFTGIFRNRVLNHVMFWVVVAGFFTLSPHGINIGLGKTLLMELIYFPSSILLTYGVLYIAVPRFLLKRKYMWFAGYMLITYVTDFGFFILVKYRVSPILGVPADSDTLLMDLFWSIMTFTFVAGVAVAIKLIRYNIQLREERAEIARQKLESEMNLLRSKINPHFLFNTLNNIDEMIYKDRDKASTYLYLLSDIMRYMLTFADRDESFLKDEINYIHNYLELIKNSFPSEDFVRFSVEGVLRQQKVPALIFIPIVENAVKHCRKKKDDHIEVSFAIEKDAVMLHSANSVRKTDQPPAELNGFGLQNLEKRLDLLYGDRYSFEYRIDDSVFTSRLKIHFL
jgi:sensor histidine kinase YesM